MSGRPQLNREVPLESVKKFRERCNHVGHVYGGDKGRHAERAIIEYVPPKYRPERFRDDLDPVIADLRADLDELGGLTDNFSLNRTPTFRSNTKTVKLTLRIADDVQESLEKYVYEQEGKVRGVIGDYVAAALDEYRCGGRTARVRTYYEQLRENVEMIPENRIESIAETLEDKFDDRNKYHIKEIKIAVDDVLGVSSEEVRHHFADRVISYLDLASVEIADGVYAPQERAAELDHSHEVDISTEWPLMDKEDRVEYLTESVEARSQQTGKGAGVTYTQVRDEIFVGYPSDPYCYTLMELAGEHPGFEYGSHNGKKMLRYLGQDDTDTPPSEPAEDWLTNAVELLKELCDKFGIDPSDLNQSVIDNKIARAQYPDRYVETEEADGNEAEDVGMDEWAINQVTEADREKVQEELIDNDSQIWTGVSKKMDRITNESKPVTDGGSSQQ